MLAVVLMIIGLWGMSFYSSPTFQNYEQVHSTTSLVDIVPQNDIQIDQSRDSNETNSAAVSHITNHISLQPMHPTATQHKRDDYEIVKSLDLADHIRLDDDNAREGRGYLAYQDDDDISIGNEEDDEGLSYNSSASQSAAHSGKIARSRFKTSSRDNLQDFSSPQDGDYYVSNPQLYEMETKMQQSRRASIVSRRTMGLMSAVFNGVWGGSIMVPMHYAPKEAHGMGYVISFAIGATIITICLWICRFAYYYFIEGMTLYGSYHSLPSFHFRVMWKPGGTAGLLWSIGNLASMISVQQLGEGVGYSLTQSSMLISGIWGIFYFQEVKGVAIRTKWFMSAIITITGILMLSFEHVNDNGVA